MIIRFFKKSYFSRILVLFLLILLFWLPETVLLSQKTYPAQIAFIHLNPWLMQLLAVFLFFFITLLVNRISTEHRLTKINSYITAFFFVLVGSASGLLTRPGPYLASAFFLVLFYQKVFRFQNNTKIIPATFDAGILLGIVSLFYPPMVIMVVFVWIALIIYQTDQWRAYFTTVLGTLVPWFFIFLGYFWFDKLPELFSWILPYFRFRAIWMPFTNTLNLIMFLVIATITMVSTLSLLGSMSSLNIRLNKHAHISLWAFLLSILIIFLTAAPVQFLMLAALPASLVIGTFFSQIKKLRWANLFVWLWLLFILVNHYLPLLYAA